MHDEICKLETDIDDTSGEALGYTLERLLKAGALEAHFVPVQMKKNRPAYELVVLCKLADKEKLEQIIFAETTTIGIRMSVMQRDILSRRAGVVRTSYGDVEVKICQLAGAKRVYVEYASAARVAREQGVPLQDVYLAVKLAQKNII